MLAKVKLALGLTTSVFDSDIEDNILSARAELIRSGVSEAKAMSDDDALITKAIKTFCQKEYYEGNEASRYERAWRYQVDNLRKSAEYIG